MQQLKLHVEERGKSRQIAGEKKKAGVIPTTIRRLPIKWPEL